MEAILGLSFQIIDDVMDILGNESELKKTPGQDLDLGELPYHYYYFLRKNARN